MVQATGVVEAEGLTKRFGSFTAVDGIDLHIAPGEAFGMLGPNGAGKTSTMRMVGAISPPTAGRLRILGLDPTVDGSAVRARLGWVPQEDALDAELSILDNVVVHGRYFGLSRPVARRRATELLELFDLADRAGERVESLSGGMRRRLTLARALVNEPDLLLLDEPTTGLDPHARHALWSHLHELRARGLTLVLTTHYMDEAEQLCDRLVIIDGGRIVAEGSPRALIERHAPGEVVELRVPDPDARDRARTILAGDARRVETVGDRLVAYTPDGDALAAEVSADGVEPASILVRRSSLEDVFLVITGRALEG